MEKVEELAEALKAVEDELNLAKRVYLAFPFIFWGAVLPMLYLLSNVLSWTSEWFQGSFGGNGGMILSTLAIIWFFTEEKRIFKKIEALERILGVPSRKSRRYMLSQIASWFLAGMLAFVFSLSTPTQYEFKTAEFMLLFVGLGVGFIVLSTLFFLRRIEWPQVLASLIDLSALYLLNHLNGTMNPQTFSVMVVSASFTFTAFLYIRRAMRE
ncbi:hypothetical protein [Thermococcus sp.]|uniref:hypothetical protein n=1 Tax=Thermococcus sp. TaxID=35749 RepID=UPI00262A3A85|nr:hypothetical protein [Thermococcus sp.]